MITFIFYLAATIVIISALLQLIPFKHWIFRVPEYLCRQLSWLGGVTLFFSLFFTSSDILLIFQGVLVLTLVYLFVKVFPYTRWGRKDVMDTTLSDIERVTITILVINVYQSNKEYKKVVDTIKEVDADVALLVECDSQWKEGLNEVYDKYPERILLDRDDTYGMFLLSKYEILKEEVRTVYDETPSIKCNLLVHDHIVSLFGLHPKPPSPTEASTSAPKDAELDYVSREIKDLGENKKVIVIGDLNDVAWSLTTNAFLNGSNLRDPRKGRGSIVTFPTYALLFGFPLDQVLCSPHFTVDEIKRLKDVGSDHFPLFTSLSFGL